jgi:hypothetical protein
MFNLFKKVTLASLMCSTFFFSAQSSAELISTDWLVEGDKKAVLDTNTGIEWLRFDLTMLRPRSTDLTTAINAVRAEFEPLGWRLPTKNEVIALIQGNLYAPVYGVNDTSIPSDQKYKSIDFRAKFSYSSIFDSHYASGAFFDDDAQEWRHAGASTWYGGTTIFGAKLFSNYGLTTYHSLMLVSDGGVTLSSINDPTLNINNPNAPINAVSEPSAIALLGIGLLGFAGIRKTKKQLFKAFKISSEI